MSDPKEPLDPSTDETPFQPNESGGDYEFESSSSGMTPSGLTLLVLVSELTLTFIAAGVAFWFGFHDPSFTLYQAVCEFREYRPLVGVVLAIPMFGFIVGLLPRVPRIQESMASIEQQLKPLFRDMRIWQAFFISCCAGIGEEIFFRWFLLGGLSQYFTWWWACLLSSILFGLGHYLSHTYFMITAGVGVLLAMIYWYFGLAAAITCHATYDFLAILYLRNKYSVAAVSIG